MAPFVTRPALTAAIAAIVLSLAVPGPASALDDPAGSTMTLTGDINGTPFVHQLTGTVTPATIDPQQLPVDGVHVIMRDLELLKGDRTPGPCSDVHIPASTQALDGWSALAKAPPFTLPDEGPTVHFATPGGSIVTTQDYLCEGDFYNGYHYDDFDFVIPTAQLAELSSGCYQFHGYNVNVGHITSVDGAFPLLRVGAVDCSGGNRPPVGVNDVASTTAGHGVDVPVLANDHDPDGDSLDLVSVQDPANGTADIERGSETLIRYFPRPGFIGEDVFGYQLKDSHGNLATASVRVTVEGPTATIVIREQLLNAADAGHRFSFTGAVSGKASSGKSLRASVLAPGTYTVAQTPESGWDLDAISCDNQATTDLSNRQATISVVPGSTTTCTYTNRRSSQGLVSVTTSYAYAKALPGVWNGGDDVEVVVNSVARPLVLKVCITEKWVATIKRIQSTVIAQWNGETYPFTDAGPFADWSVLDGDVVVPRDSAGLPVLDTTAKMTMTVARCAAGAVSLHEPMPNLIVTPFGQLTKLTHTVTGSVFLAGGQVVSATPKTADQPGFRPTAASKTVVRILH